MGNAPTKITPSHLSFYQNSNGLKNDQIFHVQSKSSQKIDFVIGTGPEHSNSSWKFKIVPESGTLNPGEATSVSVELLSTEAIEEESSVTLYLYDTKTDLEIGSVKCLYTSSPRPRSFISCSDEEEEVKSPTKEAKARKREKVEYFEGGSHGNFEALPLDNVLAITSFLPLTDLVSLMRTCRKMKQILSTNETWRFLTNERFHSYQNQLAVANAKKELDWNNFYRYLRNSKKYAKEIYICHMGSNQYWVTMKEPTSDIGEKAYLRTVCWLDIQSKHLVVPGKYKVIWRMFFDSKTSLEFDSHWTVTLQSEEDQNNVLLEYRTKRRDKKLKEAVGGWCEWEMGTFTANKTGTVTVKSEGGNNYWFGGWSLDYIQLIYIE